MKRRSFLALASAAVASRTFAAPLLRAPLASALSLPLGQPVVRFIAFGDAGTGDDQQLELARVMAKQQTSKAFDTALLLGDNIYPDGDLANVAEKFEKPYADLLHSGVKFRAVLGNHDVKKGREQQLKYPHFGMNGRAYYSFTQGAMGDAPLVEFFALDSNAFDGAQQQWIAGALSASRARWKVVYFHHPIYSSGDKHGSDESLRGKLEPLLVKHGVTAVFSGHDHIYERTKPLQGVQYFVAGAGGKLRKGDLNRNSAFMAFGSDETSSFMSVEATPDKFSFQAIDTAGKVIDAGEMAPRVRVATASVLDKEPRRRFAVAYPAQFVSSL